MSGVQAKFNQMQQKDSTNIFYSDQDALTDDMKALHLDSIRLHSLFKYDFMLERVHFYHRYLLSLHKSIGNRLIMIE